jgi:hypothetical protein
LGPSLTVVEGVRRRTAALGGPGGAFLKPIELTNAHYLNVQVSLHLMPVDGGGERWKVMQSRFQYQLDDVSASKHWIFRYDYVRQPASVAGGIDAFAPHLNVSGRHSEIEDEVPLNSVHFPTRRMSVESTIRLLITNYNVPANSPDATWRPMLAEAENMFREIAHENPPPR